MFNEAYESIVNSSKIKIKLLENNPVAYFILAMLAGIFVGIGVLLTNAIGAQLNGSPFTKLIIGATFTIALSLVVFAGAELFTGNNFALGAGVLRKEVSILQAIKLWVVCYIGNALGSILVGSLYYLTTLGDGSVYEFMCRSTIAKTSFASTSLIASGILCNLLVCLAVWCGARCESESGKLIMIFWCILGFATTGFEHCVANMTLFTVSYISKVNELVTLSAIGHNLLWVTIGNMIGGIVFVAIPYAIISKDK